MITKAGVAAGTIANIIDEVTNKPISQRMPRVSASYCTCPKGKAMREVANSQV